MTREMPLEHHSSARLETDSTVLDAPKHCVALYVLAHGAGAGMRHPFLEAMSERLVAREIATFRYQFPYMAAGKGRPDPPAVLEGTVRTAVEQAGVIAAELGGRGHPVPLIAGGKSLGGRMTSNAQARGPLPAVRGLAFLGFPLHPPKRPGTERATHLAALRVPLLFLQGTRDDLADLTLLRPVCAGLEADTTLHVVEGADHGFEVLKRSGRTGDAVLDELADALRTWIDRIIGAGQ